MRTAYFPRAAMAAVIVIAGWNLPAQIQAEELKSRSVLATGSALTVAQEAVAACKADGYSVSVSVVDSAGVVLVTLRDESAGPHTVSTSQRKAYTALSTRMPTSGLVGTVNENPPAEGLRQIDGFLVLGGGIPIRAREEVVGAVGVSGAPGGHLDDACAEAGLAAISELLGKD